MEPIAYTYEADVHCPACAEKRFGLSWNVANVANIQGPQLVFKDRAQAEAYASEAGFPVHGPFIADNVEDNEGNEPGAVFSYSERGGDGTGAEACGTCGEEIRPALEDDEPQIDEAQIETELATKAVVVRDGARGWRLGACFVEDALGLLEGANVAVDRAAFEIPDEDDVDYTQTLADYERELEDALDAAGFTTYWNDGYVIYKDLSEAALTYTAEGMG